MGVLVAMVSLGEVTAPAAADSVVAWGYNQYGQLGNGTSDGNPHPTPVPVSGLSSGVNTIAAGGDSLAIKDGAVWAWGNNWYGQIGDGTTTHRATPVTVVGLSSGISSIGGGGWHSLAVKDGGIWAWGDNQFGQLGEGTTNLSITPVAVRGLSSGVSGIAAGNYHSLAIKDGGAWAWGYNLYGQLGIGTQDGSPHPTPVAVSGMSSGVSTIAAGASHTLAIKTGGVWAWGANAVGQIGDGTSGSQEFRSTPVAVIGLSSGVSSIAAGEMFSLAVKDGGVWGWGSNYFSEIGDGTKIDRLTPVQIDPAHLHDIVGVAACNSSSYALSADGSLWVWGTNQYYGQLGLGDLTNRLTPTHLLPPEGYRFTSIAAGEYHALATLALVPEPGTLSLLALATCGLLRRRRDHVAKEDDYEAGFGGHQVRGTPYRSPHRSPGLGGLGSDPNSEQPELPWEP